jgi:hypothetical protein
MMLGVSFVTGTFVLIESIDIPCRAYWPTPRRVSTSVSAGSTPTRTTPAAPAPRCL